MKKTLLVTVITFSLLACKKEVSAPQKCGKIVFMDYLYSHIYYPDGSYKTVRSDSTSYVGKPVCDH
jgi:hypothetical protein